MFVKFPIDTILSPLYSEIVTFHSNAKLTMTLPTLKGIKNYLFGSKRRVAVTVSFLAILLIAAGFIFNKQLEKSFYESHRARLLQKLVKKYPEEIPLITYIPEADTLILRL